MSPEQKQFLSLTILPARLTAEQTAWYLGFAVYEIPTLVAAGVLQPLGHPAHSCTKYFAVFELEQLKSDRKWLSKASDAIRLYWQTKNGRRRTSRKSANASIAFADRAA